MTTTRTQQEILDRIAHIGPTDLFRFQTNDLADYLTKENLATLLENPNDAHSHDQRTTPPAEHIAEYMAFAWYKANNTRGLSSMRSLEHMKAWVWLDNQPELLAILEGTDYHYYGKDHLVAICKHYNIDWRPLDNDEWVNS